MIQFETHIQTVPSSSWVITHNFNSPVITDVLVDGGLGTLVKMIPLDVIQDSLNQVTIMFSTPTAGRARLIGTRSAAPALVSPGSIDRGMGDFYQLSDPYFDFVVFSTHFDGANGSQVIEDKSSYGVVPTVIGSGAISTSDSKFGGSSWNGSDWTVFQLNLGSNGMMTGDFTWEVWHKSGSNGTIFYSTSGGGHLYNEFFQGYGGPLIQLPYVNGSTFEHLAISRTGSTLKTFRNGVQQGSVTYSGDVDLRQCDYGRYVPNGNLYFNGYLDDLRITKGVGRYTASFSPPTYANPDL